MKVIFSIIERTETIAAGFYFLLQILVFLEYILGQIFKRD